MGQLAIFCVQTCCGVLTCFCMIFLWYGVCHRHIKYFVSAVIGITLASAIWSAIEATQHDLKIAAEIPQVIARLVSIFVTFMLLRYFMIYLPKSRVDNPNRWY